MLVRGFAWEPVPEEGQGVRADEEVGGGEVGGVAVVVLGVLALCILSLCDVHGGGVLGQRT